MGLLRREEAAYQTQDLACVKCKQVRPGGGGRGALLGAQGGARRGAGLTGLCGGGRRCVGACRDATSPRASERPCPPHTYPHAHVPPYTPTPPPQVTSGHLRSLCGLCGGGLVVTRGPEAAARRLTVFRNLARFHGFGMLRELAGWLLGEEPEEAERERQADAEEAAAAAEGR